jgi:hyaluronan synthase
MDLCVINDGSDDNSLREITLGTEVARAGGIDTFVVNWIKNRGKREAMAEGIRRTRGDIIVLVDSDSFLERGAVQALVRPFADPRIAATTGHARVHNPSVNLLTKMQNVRYYIAFSVYKSAEAVFGAVTCCSGCCSAYRRSALDQILQPWRNQKFLGAQCTYGDDRSLTNHLLRLGYRTVFVPDAMSSTIVPDDWNVFLKQQLRWKKSWIRESMIAATFMWKRHPVMAASFYAGLILPLVSPAVVFRSLLWIPIVLHRIPTAYLFGIGVMAMIYGFYYYMNTKDRDWLSGFVFAALSTVILIWQLPLAILTLRDGSWGTR